MQAKLAEYKAKVQAATLGEASMRRVGAVKELVAFVEGMFEEGDWGDVAFLPPPIAVAPADEAKEADEAAVRVELLGSGGSPDLCAQRAGRDPLNGTAHRQEIPGAGVSVVAAIGPHHKGDENRNGNVEKQQQNNPKKKIHQH